MGRHLRRRHTSIALVAMSLAASLVCVVDRELLTYRNSSVMIQNRSASCHSDPWAVYVLSGKAREFAVKKNLVPVFPCLQVVNGISREEVIVPKLQFTVAKPSDWDFPDRRILKTAYRESSYPGQGEVAVTIGHRRILESFLRAPSDQRENDVTYKQVALILEDDAIPHVSIRVKDDLFEIIEKMKSLDWDLIQLGRCYDIYCHKDSQLYPVRVLKDGTRIQKSKGFELCSHAYLVSKNGAEKIMQYSYPVLLPYVSISPISDLIPLPIQF